MSKPYISVIIPAFNEEAFFLPRCLESLQQQKNAPSFEVIVVDNNSTDDTSQVAKHFDVTLIHDLKQGGACSKHWTCCARGEIIVSTDADTYFPETWLAYIGNYFKENPEIAGLAGHYHYVKGPLWARFWPVMGAIAFKIIYEITGNTVYVSAANLAFRKSFQRL